MVLHNLEVRKKMAEYEVNDVIMHKELGRGTIRALDKQLIDIDFADGSRQLNLEVLVKNDLISKL
ncbi:GNAT family protein [Aneurinibacillus sp. REN35]|uniref:hypothetical protein n=1 Tax=Aneurinibacillus sp. REN35 TaxID=3237286 RepID=UPI0035298DE4